MELEKKIEPWYEKISEDKKRTYFLILLTIVIILMVFSIVILIKNIDIIGKDPISYGMKKHNLEYCSCKDKQGNFWTTNGTLLQVNKVIKYGTE